MEQTKDVGKSQTSPEGTVQDVIIEINNYKITSPNDISTADKIGGYTDKIEKAADIGIKAIDMIDGIAEKVGFTGMKPVTGILKGVFSTAKDGAAKTKQTAQSADKLHKANKLKKGLLHEQKKKEELAARNKANQQNANNNSNTPNKAEAGNKSAANQKNSLNNTAAANANKTDGGNKTVASQQRAANNNTPANTAQPNNTNNGAQGNNKADEGGTAQNKPASRFQRAGETLQTVGEMSKGIFDGLGNTAGVIGDIAGKFGATDVANGANAAKGLAGALGATSGSAGTTVETAATAYSGKSSNLEFLNKLADTFVSQSSEALKASAEASESIASTAGNEQAANVAKTIVDTTKETGESAQELFKAGFETVKDTKEILQGDGSTLDKVLGAGHSITGGLGTGVSSSTGLAGSIARAAGADGAGDVLGKISEISGVVTEHEESIKKNLDELLAVKKTKEVAKTDSKLSDKQEAKKTVSNAVSQDDELVAHAQAAQEEKSKEVNSIKAQLEDIEKQEKGTAKTVLTAKEKKELAAKKVALTSSLKEKEADLEKSKKVVENAGQVAAANKEAKEAERLADEANERLMEAMQLTAENAQSMDAETAQKIKEKIAESSRLNKESVEKAMNATKMAVEATPELEEFKSTVITDVELMATDGSIDNPFVVFLTGTSYERCINKLREKLGEELTLAGEHWRDPALVPNDDNKLYEVKAKQDQAFFVQLRLLPDNSKTADEKTKAKEILGRFRVILNAKTLNIAGYAVKQGVQQLEQQKGDKKKENKQQPSSPDGVKDNNQETIEKTKEQWFYSYLVSEPLIISGSKPKHKNIDDKVEQRVSLDYCYNSFTEEYADKQDIKFIANDLFKKIETLVNSTSEAKEQVKTENKKSETEQKQDEKNKKIAEANKKAETEKNKAQVEKALMKELSIMISESIRFRFLQKNTANIIKNNKSGELVLNCIFTEDKKLVISTEKVKDSRLYHSFSFYQLLKNVDKSWQQISQSLWKKNSYYISLSEKNGTFILFPKRELEHMKGPNKIYNGLDIIGIILS